MNLERIKKFIHENDLWIEECPATHQACEWAWRGFIESSKYFSPKLLSLGIFIYKNDFFSEVTSRNEKNQQFIFAAKRFKNDKNYLKKKKNSWDKIIKELTAVNKRLFRDIDNLSRKDLAILYIKLASLYISQAHYSVFMECVDTYTEDILPKILKELLPKCSIGEIGHIAVAMSAPANLSFMEQERIDFLKGCILVNADRANALRISKYLENKYFWMAVNYIEAPFKSSDIFKQEIFDYLKNHKISRIKDELDSLINKKKSLRKEKIDITKKYRLNKKIISTFVLINEMGAWIDERKRYVLETTFNIYRLLGKFEEILGVPASELAYATHGELGKWIEGGKGVNRSILKERRVFSVCVLSLKKKGKSNLEFIVGKEAKKIYNSVFNTKKIKEMKGTVASAPVKIIKGRVSVILDSRRDKFKDGDILVTSMTRPDFLPLMRRAKAIVTDEGGLTCHAAIISREMKKPCIIGTKAATKMLRSGQLIEMNLEDGKVKIL